MLAADGGKEVAAGDQGTLLKLRRPDVKFEVGLPLDPRERTRFMTIMKKELSNLYNQRCVSWQDGLLVVCSGGGNNL